MSPVQIVVIVVVVIAVALVAAGVVMAARRRSLRSQFGPEYDRLVAERDDRRAAERELRERVRRHAQLDLRPLSEESRARYEADWEEIQARFVDTPVEAVDAADKLLSRLIAERGYPTGDFDELTAHLSVEHARTLQRYRDAREVGRRTADGEVDTERLRQALVHFRALFADLLGGSSAGQASERRPAAPTVR
ncbi:hypothetical protein HC031_11740 [Planosporangium thailandense]|uniref:Secreted protein n=1 Tax=Planosporangium thailandense TaxID=765197 RepID=A0ABX0XWE9_9ACTN|nr:hypothetical protein [Planosporangium thailandense]NJC70378.1 hypothetical protein [Planosporangium thailandense]